MFGLEFDKNKNKKLISLLRSNQDISLLGSNQGRYCLNLCGCLLDVITIILDPRETNMSVTITLVLCKSVDLLCVIFGFNLMGYLTNSSLSALRVDP